MEEKQVNEHPPLIEKLWTADGFRKEESESFLKKEPLAAASVIGHIHSHRLATQAKDNGLFK